MTWANSNRTSVTIISFLRLKSIVRYASTANPTWDLWGIVWWSGIEVCAGLICTCLPAMRLLLLRVAPRVFGSDSHIQRYETVWQAEDPERVQVANFDGCVKPDCHSNHLHQGSQNPLFVLDIPLLRCVATSPRSRTRLAQVIADMSTIVAMVRPNGLKNASAVLNLPMSAVNMSLKHIISQH